MGHLAACFIMCHMDLEGGGTRMQHWYWLVALCPSLLSEYGFELIISMAGFCDTRSGVDKPGVLCLQCRGGLTGVKNTCP